jgi:hypothetical protein
VDYPVRLLVKLLLAGSFVWLGVRIRVITAENIGHVRNLMSLKSRILIQRN